MAGQKLEGGPGHVDVGYYHRGEGLAGGGLEGHFPARVDINGIEQGANHAIELAQPGRPGPRPGRVERSGQYLDPGLLAPQP